MLKMDAVHLTDAGRELVSSFSWRVTEAELERMRRLHEMVEPPSGLSML